LSVAGLSASSIQNTIRIPSTGALAVTGLAPTFSIVDITWDGANNLLVHTISAAATTDTIGTAAVNLLRHSLSATGDSGTTSTASITLLAPTLVAGGNHGAQLNLLAHTANAQGISGAAGSADIALKPHTLSAAGLADNSGIAIIQLLGHTASATGLLNAFGVLDAALARHTLESTGYSGAVGTAGITLLQYDLAAVAFQPGTGTSEIELLARSLDSAGFAALAETYRTWVLNLRTNGLTEYDSFAFNSFAVLDGVYLAAGPTGIHVLGAQDLDDEAAIGARVRTGSPDFGSSMLKRVPRLYVTGQFQDDLYFRTITSQDGERTYILHENGITGNQQRRVPIGKGPKSVEWQFEVENIEGGELRVSKILTYPQELRRRVQ